MNAPVWLPSILDCVVYLLAVGGVLVGCALTVLLVAHKRPGGACERLTLAVLPCPEPSELDDYTARWEGLIAGTRIGEDR